MIPIASIIKEYEEDYIQEYNSLILPSHYKALYAMKTCRSSHSPKMLMKCESKECSNRVLVPHSCGHRHCPHCQNHETTLWIDKQLQKQVPSDYFMITFTLPAQFRAVAWFNQRTLYSALFNSAWNTIKSFSLNDKKLGGTPGAITVLHTNSRELNFHPNSKKTLLILRWVFRVNSDYGKQTEVKPRKKMVCSCCGAFMEIIKTRIMPYELIPEGIP